MITVTPSAATHIMASAKQGNMSGMPLRLAVTKTDAGDFHYALGFDDTAREGDEIYTSERIDIVVAPSSIRFLTGTIIDYVELDGKEEVIFINPNDPSQQQSASKE